MDSQSQDLILNALARIETKNDTVIEWISRHEERIKNLEEWRKTQSEHEFSLQMARKPILVSVLFGFTGIISTVINLIKGQHR